MISLITRYNTSIICVALLMAAITSCKNKKKTLKTETPVTISEDSLSNRCRLDHKSARTLSKNVKENEFIFDWVYAKANVEALVDDKEESFDIKVSIRRDSAMLVSVHYLLGLQVAKLLITKDSVKFVNYIQKTYFTGDFVYINNLLNADLDFELLQAVLFGNSAEFQEDESKLKPVTDKQNCHYLLSTERKRKLRKIQAGVSDIKNSLQTLTLNPDNYKILKNEFIEPATNRQFIANYSKFQQKDSVYAPYHVDIDIVAQKKANIKIDYVRIEKNTPQKLSLNIPAKYDPIQIQKK
ncbi:DUF4292 domain-containing protein [Aurantibacillus circumpalustris]|uniref:DUF4292 domain-containing protein n=1 Tax=Aurantibacillus circumpalustris TaxID=3036359 RepID=UPI00295BAFB5|nr:DUF4292 domain-containing protein [Aurantibacillus circumpalustris]